jgi:MFS family permease
MPRLPKSLTALQHRNFRLLWFGQLISMSGSMMQSAAILWHITLLVPQEQQGLALGLVGLVRVLPIVGFSLIGGMLADVVERRKMMLITQSGMTVVAMLLAWFTFSGLKVVWPIYVLAALGAAFGAFDGPARQSLIPNLVPREHLPNAISLNTIMFQTASVFGPVLGGAVIASHPELGVGRAYAYNALSFLFVILALLLMRDIPPRAAQEKSDVSLRAMGEGLRFVFTQPIIRSTMLLDFWANFFGMATKLLPIFAQTILHVGPVGYGWLTAASAIGSMLTSIAMVRLVDKIDRRGRAMVWSVLAYGAATVVFGLSRNFYLTFLALALTGAADTVSVVIRNLVRQLVTPDHLRGRMIGVNMIFFMGGPELGELEAGLVADWISAPFSVASGGITCLLVSACIAWQTPELRAYRREAPALAGQAAD